MLSHCAWTTLIFFLAFAFVVRPLARAAPHASDSFAHCARSSTTSSPNSIAYAFFALASNFEYLMERADWTGPGGSPSTSMARMAATGRCVDLTVDIRSTPT